MMTLRELTNLSRVLPQTGVTYIAQVLKRNRTLKVCNLADNRIDVAGLVALAEALKYNSTLDTLDLSSNPCCGPALEGVRSSCCVCRKTVEPPR